MAVQWGFSAEMVNEIQTDENEFEQHARFFLSNGNLAAFRQVLLHRTQYDVTSKDMGFFTSACNYEHFHIAKWLLAMGAKCSIGETFLHCSHSGNLRALHWLASLKEFRPEEWSERAMEKAAEEYQYRVMKWLALRFSVEVPESAGAWKTLLDRAVKRQRRALEELLPEHRREVLEFI